MKFAIFPRILEISQMYTLCRSTILHSLGIKLVIGIRSILEAVKFNTTFFLYNFESCRLYTFFLTLY